MSTSVLEKINQTKFEDYLNKMKKDSIESDKSDKSDDNENNNKSNNRQIIKKRINFTDVRLLIVTNLMLFM